jgi:hypothetical protein
MTDLSKWVAAHRCTYDISPLIELDAGQPNHTGFELNLHAELPIGDTITPELGKDLDEVRDKLGEIFEMLIPKDAKARIERVPFRRSVRYPRGAGKHPIVTRTVRIFRPEYAALEAEDREKLGPTEERLAELGFTRT